VAGGAAACPLGGGWPSSAAEHCAAAGYDQPSARQRIPTLLKAVRLAPGDRASDVAAGTGLAAEAAALMVVPSGHVTAACLWRRAGVAPGRALPLWSATRGHLERLAVSAGPARPAGFLVAVTAAQRVGQELTRLHTAAERAARLRRTAARTCPPPTSPCASPCSPPAASPSGCGSAHRRRSACSTSCPPLGCCAKPPNGGLAAFVWCNGGLRVWRGSSSPQAKVETGRNPWRLDRVQVDQAGWRRFAGRVLEARRSLPPPHSKQPA
jgi:hypothetical protein